MDKEYTVPMVCSNCDYAWPGIFLRGQTVPDWVNCPHCGCLTAHKNANAGEFGFREE